MLGFGADIAHSRSAVGTVDQAGKTVGISTVSHSRLFVKAYLSGNIPCILVNNRFVGIGENHQLVRCCCSALLGFEILTDGFAQHGMTKIFLPVQNVANGGGVPLVRICNFNVSAVFGEMLGGIG